MPANHIVMQGAALAQRHTRKAPLSSIRCLTYSFGNFACLAVTKTDTASLVADDNKGGETETPTTLHHFRDAIDVNQLVGKLAVAFFTLATAALPTFSSFLCHMFNPYPCTFPNRLPLLGRGALEQNPIKLNH